MRRLLNLSLVTGFCVAITAMFVPTQQAEAQFRVYAGSGGVGIGYGNYGNYGGYRGYGNNLGYGSRYYSGYRGYNNGWGGFDRYPGYGYRSYRSPSYYNYRGNLNYYAPRRSYTYQRRSPGYYSSQDRYSSQDMVRREQMRPERPVMGIRIQNAQEGVRVVVVQPGSPAAQAGLQVGDVITSFNGQAITSEQSLLNELDRLQLDSNAQLTVMTGDRNWDANVNLTTYQDAFMSNVADDMQDDRRTVGRPMLDEERTPEQMQREIDSLRNEVDRLRGSEAVPGERAPMLQNDATKQPAVEPEVELGEPPVETEGELDTELNPPADGLETDAELDAEAAESLETEARNQAELEADAI